MRVGDSKYIVDFIKDKETGEIYSPYQTIQCATEKDFLNLLSALDRQRVKKLITWANGTEHCSNCDHDLSQRDYNDTHCPRCGQRYKETQRVNKG